MTEKTANEVYLEEVRDELLSLLAGKILTGNVDSVCLARALDQFESYRHRVPGVPSTMRQNIRKQIRDYLIHGPKVLRD